MTSLGALNFGDLQNPRKRQKRKRPEEAQKRSGKGQKRPGKGQERHQKARTPEFGEKLIETSYFEQKMTSLGAPRKGPKKGQKRPRRGQKRLKEPEEARKRLEEARKRPEDAWKRLWRKIARNALFYEQNMTSLGAPQFGQEEARKRLEEARRGTKKARNPEFGEKLLETQYFRNRK